MTYAKMWKVEHDIHYHYSNDCAKSVCSRSDYRLGIKAIQDAVSYDRWILNHFGDGVDIDTVLVFAAISRDLQHRVSDKNTYVHHYSKWLCVIIPCLDCYDQKFLRLIWNACKFV